MRKTADGLRTSNTRLDEKEMEFLIDTLREVTSPEISTNEAIELSTFERSQFYKLIKDGLLPKGYHVKGFKESRHNEERLKKAVKKLKSKS